MARFAPSPDGTIVAASVDGATPQKTLRAIGLGLFDALDAPPWVAAELARGLRRADFLGDLATSSMALDATAYPFLRSVAGQFREHDDRVDFLAGINLILAGILAERAPQHTR